MSNITITNRCPFCGQTHEVEVDYRSFISWQCGELAQNAFPHLTAEEREQLISGICPDCQQDIFGSDEGDEPPFPDCTYDCDNCPHKVDCCGEEDDCDYEVGYDPYVGCYTDDC